MYSLSGLPRLIWIPRLGKPRPQEVSSVAVEELHGAFYEAVVAAGEHSLSGLRLPRLKNLRVMIAATVVEGLHEEV